jgi:hypothetical protein
MGEVPQSAEDLLFCAADLKAGCEEQIYEELTGENAQNIRNAGGMI